jgi:hypothetical protein
VTPHFGELAVAVDFKRIRTIGWSESADNSQARVLFAARRAFRYTSHVPMPELTAFPPSSTHQSAVFITKMIYSGGAKPNGLLRRTPCAVRHGFLSLVHGYCERHADTRDAFPAQAASALDAIGGGIGAGQGSAALILKRQWHA